MGEFRDLLDALEDLTDGATRGIHRIATYGTSRSIAARATDGTCYFPMPVDSNVPIDHAVIISRAFERTYASFVLTTLTMNPYMEMDETGQISAADFVRKFHQNMDLQGGKLSDINLGAITVVGGSWLAEEGLNFSNLCKKYNVDYQVVEEGINQIAFKIYEGVKSRLGDQKCAGLNFAVTEEINPSIVDFIGKPDIVMEGKKHKNKGSNSGGSGGNGSGGNSGGNNGGVLNGSGGGPINGNNGSGGNGSNGGRSNNGTPRNNTDRRQQNVDVNVRIRGDNQRVNVGTAPRRPYIAPMNHMVNTEYKKANDMVPTMLHVRVFPTSNENAGELPDPIDFVLGIKVTLHPIDSDVMIDHLARGVNAEDTFFNFIKWYTGETKFLKDFLFAIDQQKYDAKNAKAKNHNWFIASKRRKNISKIQSKFLKENPMCPIMTILVSTDTLDALYEQYGFDLKGRSNLVKRIMSTYFLLGFAIYDGTTQRVDFTIDGVSDSQVLTISTMEREATNQDRTFKEMMKAIGRSI